MAASVGGPIESVEIRGRTFAVAADADTTRSLGGFENEVAMNGDSTARLLKKAVPCSIDGLSLEIKPDRADLEFLQEVANANDFVAVNMTMCSGHTIQGKMQIVGEIKASSMNATAPIGFAGGGTLTTQ